MIINNTLFTQMILAMVGHILVLAEKATILKKLPNWELF
jgi:hypothetical protein